eukprot:16448951-Heterocapsa_arctica.AAC.2
MIFQRQTQPTGGHTTLAVCTQAQDRKGRRAREEQRQIGCQHRPRKAETRTDSEFSAGIQTCKGRKPS